MMSQTPPLGIGFAGDFGDALAVYGLIARAARAGMDGRVRVDPNGSVSVDASSGVLAKAAAAADLHGVFSPWNQGSGLVSSGKSGGLARVIDELRRSTNPLLATARADLDQVDGLVEACTTQGAINGGRVSDKAAVIAAAVFGLTGHPRHWAAACVRPILEGFSARPVDYKVNPLTGSGGNAARLDFGVTHTRCLLALAAATDEQRDEQWRSVTDATTPAVNVGVKATASQFLSLTSADRNQTNPAWMVCVMEGLALLGQAPPIAGAPPAHWHNTVTAFEAAWDRWHHVYPPRYFPYDERTIPGSVVAQALLPIPTVPVRFSEFLAAWANPAQHPATSGWGTAHFYLVAGANQQPQARPGWIQPTTFAPTREPDHPAGSIEAVTDAATTAAQSNQRLTQACLAALDAGHPNVSVAEAAGVTRQTLWRWANTIKGAKPTTEEEL